MRSRLSHCIKISHHYSKNNNIILSRGNLKYYDTDKDPHYFPSYSFVKQKKILKKNHTDSNQFI